ncbi:MAG: hypothetical protein IEMM0001_1307 [bacterium]|nr:MAG: hypothetical protein IEMM0001_1307 [bacterium]
MTLYLPGFHLATLRRKPRSAQQIMAEKLADLKQKTFSQLGECFGQFVPRKYLFPAKSGALSRRRLFSKENTFWAFLSQVLDADGGCQEVLSDGYHHPAALDFSFDNQGLSGFITSDKQELLVAKWHFYLF